MIKKILNSFLDSLYVKGIKCAACGRELTNKDSVFCDLCKRQIKFIENFCEVCGTPIDSGFYCFNCKNHIRFFDKNRAAVEYYGTIKNLILKYKFNNEQYLCDPLAKLLLKAYDLLDEKADFIVPVPSVEKRIKQRGFDHTLKLAKSFSNLTSIKMDNKILKRVSEIKPQIESHRAERIKNIKQVFKAEKINGQNIILIDDVITTGATLNECAKALKDGGANKVYAVTVAATKYKIVFETSSEMSEAANIFAD